MSSKTVMDFVNYNFNSLHARPIASTKTVQSSNIPIVPPADFRLWAPPFRYRLSAKWKRVNAAMLHALRHHWSFRPHTYPHTHPHTHTLAPTRAADKRTSQQWVSEALMPWCPWCSWLSRRFCIPVHRDIWQLSAHAVAELWWHTLAFRHRSSCRAANLRW